MTASLAAHVIVGVFHEPGAAFAALRRLDREGLPPQHVGLIAGDPELAGEAGGHSFPRAGAAGGFVLGLVVSALYVTVGGPSFHQNVPGVVLGGAFVSFGLAFIGTVLGRALYVHAPDHIEFEHAVQDGGAIVTIECAGDECDHARSVLRSAHADDVVDEIA